MEKAAKIAEAEKVDADETQHIGDFAYNMALDDCAAAIRSAAQKEA